MDPFERSDIGSCGLQITKLGLGGAALGGLYTNVSGEAAIDTVLRGLNLGISYVDTAPYYGLGKSEQMMGQALANVARNEFVLSTKVGRVIKSVESPQESEIWADLPSVDFDYDYSRDGVMRSVEDSLERLKLDRIDILLNHVPDENLSQSKEAYDTLIDLRSQGVVKAIGVGMDSPEGPLEIIQEYDVDCVLLAGRYTLLDQSGLVRLLPMCERKGVSVILGGPYSSGILASDLSPGAKFFYTNAPPKILAKAIRIKSICDRHGVPLKAAALQFGLAHPAVASTIPGARSVDEVQENSEMAAYPIQPELWSELHHEGIIPEDAPTPRKP